MIGRFSEPPNIQRVNLERDEGAYCDAEYIVFRVGDAKARYMFGELGEIYVSSSICWQTLSERTAFLLSIKSPDFPLMVIKVTRIESSSSYLE